MEAKKVAEFVEDYYREDTKANLDVALMIVAKCPECLDYFKNNMIRQILYKHYIFSDYFSEKSLLSIKRISKPQWLLTVSKHPFALKYVDENYKHYNEVALKAIKRDYSVIRYVANPSKEQKDLAISINPTSIRFFKNRTKEDIAKVEELRPNLKIWLKTLESKN